eukprot:CAMPEP_0181463774 /NCGR_PEP_ID=MMETSP1110-20121109/35087_1 /TAXON_ID=174948 /ORGANISM="Symbiodinium sp., Strain CCMP421" /LENGTH=376 /DNA_ID=CAMNT_0023588481 /DNA_START=64 /DNA_END=1194 /DNA_ORIENTATION=-
MKFSLVFLALLSLVDGSRFKRSSSLRVKPAGPLLEDLALSADGPADKAKKETDDSAVKTTESSDKDTKAEKIAESSSKEQSPADKPSEKSGEETVKKEATSKDKTQVTKEDPKKDAAATKEKPETDKKEVETAKEESKPTKATSEQAAKDKHETKEKAKTSEKESEVAKEKADAKSEKADAAKEKEEKPDETEEKAPAAVPAAAPAASPAAAPSAEAVADKKEKDKAEESADSNGQGTTTSTTLSVYDAPNVQKATTTIGPVDNETLSAYMKECAQQLKAIVKKAESYYTHEQLVIALRQECDLDKEFPTVRKVFFDHRRDCRKFAEDLGAAREAELKGDANAYSECCWTAWQEKSQAVGVPLASALLVLLSAWMM